MKHLILPVIALFLGLQSASAEMSQRPGWWVMQTNKPYDALIADVKKAAKGNGFGVVTQAGPTGAAKARGISIPGNRVIGIFNNDYAVRVLNLSTAAMIEAPIRMYVTENADDTATLSFKMPSTVFAPYMDEAGSELADIAADLDTAFQTIANAAAN